MIYFVYGTSASLFHPAFRSIIAQIVQQVHIERANSAQQIVINGGFIIGSIAVAPILIDSHIEYFTIFTAISYLISAIIIMTIKNIHPTENLASFDLKKIKEIWQEYIEGVKIIKSHPFVIAIIWITVIFYFFGVPTEVLIAPLALTHLSADNSAIALFYLTFSLGGLLSGIILILFPNIKRIGLFLFISSLTVGLLQIGLIVINSITWVAIFFMLLGGFILIIEVQSNSYIQKTIPNENQGRVFSLVTAITVGILPIAYSTISLTADYLGIVATYIVLGLILALGGSLIMLPFIKQK